jgi:hypothetical protein
LQDIRWGRLCRRRHKRIFSIGNTSYFKFFRLLID